MRNALKIPILLSLLLAVNGSAATISWAVTTLSLFDVETELGTGYEITKAVLVYTTTTEGVPVYEGTPSSYALTTGSQIGSEVPEAQIFPEYWGIGEQVSEDTTTRSEGAYYVVLFASGADKLYYSTSTSPLAWNDSSGAISENPMAPPTAVYDPSAFNSWQPIPEPGVASLLFAGLATVLLRRRRRP